MKRVWDWSIQTVNAQKWIRMKRKRMNVEVTFLRRIANFCSFVRFIPCLEDLKSVSNRIAQTSFSLESSIAYLARR